jgi:hypothetical protein
MALRTFHFNPDLGGFGGESSESDTTSAATPDAFCQIIKELVDNAVDACRLVPTKYSNQSTLQHTPENRIRIKDTERRVRVIIEKFRDNTATDNDDHEHVASQETTASVGRHPPVAKERDTEIYRVTVSDNGCGMADIQSCVDAFHTNKAHASMISLDNFSRKDELPKTKKGQSTKRKSRKKVPSKGVQDSEVPSEKQTGGRYGIGLTLCLLHAQRLVPNSCASIRSATCQDTHWKQVVCIVDMERDSVRCIFEDSAASMKSVDAKSFKSESGTSISILVPVGTSLLLLIFRDSTS